MLLHVDSLSAGYSAVSAVRDITLSLGRSKAVALLGANGAGKSTLLGAIAGLVPISAGKIIFRGENIAGLPVHERANLGLKLVPEGRRLFAEHTVYENLQLGALQCAGLMRRREFQDRLNEALGVFPMLSEWLHFRAGQLSGGEQQMVAIARAVVSRPEVLLIDEPSLGLAPLRIHELYSALARLKAAGVGIVIAEQLVDWAVSLCDEVIVLQNGKLVISKSASDLNNWSEIVTSYLGDTSYVD